eukprot:scaffold28425_cov36-Tisochrysis_lutea.AAC.1
MLPITSLRPPRAMGRASKESGPLGKLVGGGASASKLDESTLCFCSMTAEMKVPAFFGAAMAATTHPRERTTS